MYSEKPLQLITVKNLQEYLFHLYGNKANDQGLFMKLVEEWILTEKEGDIIITEENVLESKLLRKKYLDKYGM